MEAGQQTATGGLQIPQLGWRKSIQKRYAGAIYCDAPCPNCDGTCTVPTADHQGKDHMCNYPAHHYWK